MAFRKVTLWHFQVKRHYIDFFIAFTFLTWLQQHVTKRGIVTSSCLSVCNSLKIVDWFVWILLLEGLTIAHRGVPILDWNWATVMDNFREHLHSTKKAVFWDVAPCSSGVNRRFGGTYRLRLQGRRESIRKSAREASMRDVKGRRLSRTLCVWIFLYFPF
jgi:hypothetical protein